MKWPPPPLTLNQGTIQAISASSNAASAPIDYNTIILKLATAQSDALSAMRDAQADLSPFKKISNYVIASIMGTLTMALSTTVPYYLTVKAPIIADMLGLMRDIPCVQDKPNGGKKPAINGNP